MTKLGAQLPKGDGNGLDTLGRDLIASPHELHVIVALVDCKRVTRDTDTDEAEATARIRHIEVIAGDDRAAVEAILRRATDARTGSETLPFDKED